jgi:hypothetical protein
LILGGFRINGDEPLGPATGVLVNSIPKSYLSNKQQVAVTDFFKALN